MTVLFGTKQESLGFNFVLSELLFVKFTSLEDKKINSIEFNDFQRVELCVRTALH